MLSWKTHTYGDFDCNLHHDSHEWSCSDAFSQHPRAQDPDEFFDLQKSSIVHYNATINVAKQSCESKVKQRLQLVTCFDRLATALIFFANTQTAHLEMSETVRKAGEAQVSTAYENPSVG